MEAVKDEPGLYEEAESFLDGEPERFAKQNLRSSATSQRDLSSAAVSHCYQPRGLPEE